MRLESVRDQVLAAYKVAKARYDEEAPERRARRADRDAKIAADEANRETYGTVALKAIGKGMGEGVIMAVAIEIPPLGMALGLGRMATARDDKDPALFFGVLGFLGSRAAMPEKPPEAPPPVDTPVVTPGAPAADAPVAAKPPAVDAPVAANPPAVDPPIAAKRPTVETPVAPKPPVVETPVAPKPPARRPPGPASDDPALPTRGNRPGDPIEGPQPRQPPSPVRPPGGAKPFNSRPGDRLPSGPGADKPVSTESPPKAGPDAERPPGTAATEQPPPAPKPAAPPHPALEIRKVEGQTKWEAIDKVSGQQIGTAYYDTEGNLRMSINTENQAPRKVEIKGSEIHDGLLEASGGASTPFRAEWRPALPNNLETFNGARLRGLSEVDAAKSTWTAKRCAERGLTEVSQVPGGTKNPPGTLVKIRDAKGQPLAPVVDTEGVTYGTVDFMFDHAPANPAQ